MLKSAKFASVMMLVVMGSACATDDDDTGIDPACEGDDAKCDGATGSGFEIFKGIDGDYYFHLVAANGQIVMRSEGYATRQAAKKGTESVRTNGVVAANFKILEAANGEFYTNLYAKNHEVIATSETYAKKFNAERGTETARALVAKAQQIRAAKTGARFKAFVGDDHQHYFQLRGANGEVMLQSEGYVNANSAVDATEVVRSNGKTKSNYKILQAADGQYFFHLQAGNNEIIARGETYASKSNAERAVDSLVALLTSELVAPVKAVPPPDRSLADRKNLLANFQTLAGITDRGAITYFSFAEQATRPSGASCSTATAAEAASAVDAIIADVLEDDSTALSAAKLTTGHAELVDLLGTDSFTLCTFTVEGSGDGPGAQDTFILSTTTGGPKLAFRVGFE